MSDSYEFLKAQKDRMLKEQNRELETAKRLLRQCHDEFETQGRIYPETKKQMDEYWDEFGIK